MQPKSNGTDLLAQGIEVSETAFPYDRSGKYFYFPAEDEIFEKSTKGWPAENAEPFSICFDLFWNETEGWIISLKYDWLWDICRL